MSDFAINASSDIAVQIGPNDGHVPKSRNQCGGALVRHHGCGHLSYPPVTDGGVVDQRWLVVVMVDVDVENDEKNIPFKLFQVIAAILQSWSVLKSMVVWRT